jgi:transcriptional regulator NrdR family protein
MTAPKANTEAKGLVCLNCGCRHFYVVYTRPRAEKIVRRKECRHCGRRITTQEKTTG